MLKKRIKRHIIAKKHSFFVPASPGLEGLCASQLREIGLTPAIIENSGVAFEGKLEDMYQACLKLSVANRVLLRIVNFRASNFMTLEKAAGNVPWELYISTGCKINIRVNTHLSRLYHKDAIAQRILSAIYSRLEIMHGEKPFGKPMAQEIFVRAVSDYFTISIDGAGELLHMRNFKGHSGTAPLRETLGAAILGMAGYDGSRPLLDPMCGSGTFSMEAALIAKNIPAGWLRDFAFFSWPGFKEKQWLYLRRQCEKQIREIKAPLIFASDIDSKAIAHLEKQVSALSFENLINVSHGDFLKTGPPDQLSQPGLVVINPPYGVRLGTKNSAEQLFRAMCEHLEANFKGWRAAILVPRRSWTRYLAFIHSHAGAWERKKQHELFHGGLKVPLIVGKI